VGQHVSKILDSYCNSSVDNLSKISFEELDNIDGIGLIVAQAIIDFFQNNNNSIIVKNCFTKGVSIKKTIFNDSLKFAGEIFVITGSFNTYSRLQIKELLEKEGGRVTNSISSKTNFLIIGENPGAKLDKARKNNVKTINEDEFKTLLRK
jgi:DNA ligase (NAD+)